MLGWSLTFTVVALIAAILGYTSIGGDMHMSIARALSGVFAVMAIGTFIVGIFRARREL